MAIEKDYIKTLRHIRHNFERAEHLAWDDMRGEYKNAIEAIDKAIEALQDKGYRSPIHCPFCGGDATLHSANDKMFWVRCEKCSVGIQPEYTPEAAIEKWNHRASNHKDMDLDKLFKNFCSYIENLSSEELEESLRKAEENSKDSYIFDNYDN